MQRKNSVQKNKSPSQVKLGHFTVKLILSFLCSLLSVSVVSQNSASQSWDATLRGQCDKIHPNKCDLDCR